MTDTRVEQVEEALTELRRRIKAEEPLDRFLARAILVPLGTLHLEESEEAARLARALREASEAVAEAWAAALDSELQLAATEHVRSVDPRFLDKPIYDFAYTVAARERLEARLVAASLLAYEVDESLLDRVAEADRLLAPYLEQR